MPLQHPAQPSAPTPSPPRSAKTAGVLSMDGERDWTVMLGTEANEASPMLSPDGSLIAYHHQVRLLDQRHGRLGSPGESVVCGHF